MFRAAENAALEKTFPCIRSSAMRLSEKYRPRTLDDIVGQPPVRMLRALAAKPYSCCVLLECSFGGVGKTSAAIAFANEIGCEDDFSGQHIVSCSEFSVDYARKLFQGADGSAASLLLRPMQGSGWHCLILEEFDWLPPQTQRFLKVALETRLPSKCIVIATSNGAGNLDAALLQRFRCYSFSSGKQFAAAAQERLAEIWRIEVGDMEMPSTWKHWGFTSDGQFSLRVALDRMQDHLSLLETAA
jgi:replication-associated recombination protein RarA